MDVGWDSKPGSIIGNGREKPPKVAVAVAWRHGGMEAWRHGDMQFKTRLHQADVYLYL